MRRKMRKEKGNKREEKGMRGDERGEGELRI